MGRDWSFVLHTTLIQEVCYYDYYEMGLHIYWEWWRVKEAWIKRKWQHKCGFHISALSSVYSFLNSNIAENAVNILKNILLIKSNLKFESRATAVSIAISARYLGGKYRSRLHPR